MLFTSFPLKRRGTAILDHGVVHFHLELTHILDVRDYQSQIVGGLFRKEIQRQNRMPGFLLR